MHTEPQLRCVGREDGAGVGAIQHPGAGAHLRGELARAPARVAGVDAQPLTRPPLGERRTQVRELTGEVDVGQHGAGGGGRPLGPHQGQDGLRLDRSAPVEAKVPARGDLHAAQELPQRHARGPVHHEPHRAFRAVLDEQHHGLDEVRVLLHGRGVEEEARPELPGIAVRAGAGGGQRERRAGGEPAHGVGRRALHVKASSSFSLARSHALPSCSNPWSVSVTVTGMTSTRAPLTRLGHRAGACSARP